MPATGEGARPVAAAAAAKRRPPAAAAVPAAPPAADLSAPDAPARPEVDRLRLAESMVRRDLLARHLRLGKLYREYRLPGDARGEFQTVVNLDPLSSEARVAQGLLEELVGAAEPSTEERIEGYREMATFLSEGRDDENARLQCEKILHLREDDAAARKSLGFLLARAGRLEEAESQLRAAIAAAPGFPEALVVLGYVKAQQRRYREAATHFANAAESAPAGSRSRRYAEEMLKKMQRFTDLR
jgi:tetratricopeptide (TPR) repeat protein